MNITDLLDSIVNSVEPFTISSIQWLADHPIISLTLFISIGILHLVTLPKHGERQWFHPILEKMDQRKPKNPFEKHN